MVYLPLGRLWRQVNQFRNLCPCPVHGFLQIAVDAIRRNDFDINNTEECQGVPQASPVAVD